MEKLTTLHINIDPETKRKYKVLCTLDNWTIQQRTEYLVKEWIKMNEYKITGLDKQEGKMKKLVCGLSDVYDKKWKTVYASDYYDAVEKAYKHCGRNIQKGFSLVVGEFENYYRINFAGQKVVKQWTSYEMV